MKKLIAMGLCAAAALAVGGAAASSSPDRPRNVPAGIDPRLLAAITRANSEFEVAMTKGDIRPIVAPYTDDAVFVGFDGTSVKGKAQIESLYRERFARSGPALETRIESEQLILDGDLAYERGRGSITRNESGKRVTDWARFFTIWQRQPDGSWLIFRNVVLPASRGAK